MAMLCATGCSGGPGSPAPGGTPAARQVPEQPFGLKWDGYQHPPRYDADIEAYGGGGTFHELVWCAIETRQGTRYWDLDDQVVAGLLAHGYRVLLRIRVGSCWASGRPTADRPRIAVSYPPVDTAVYQAFVRDAVLRYAAKGVHMYGIENEIDARNMWGGDPLGYRDVGRAGAEAVRAADPGARLLDVGLTSGSYGVVVARTMLDAGQADRALAFYRTFYARGDGRFPPAATAGELRAVIDSPPGLRATAAHAAAFELDRAGVFDAYQLHYYDSWAAVPDVIDYIRAQVGPVMPIEGWEVGSYWPGDDYDPVAHGVETAKLVTILLARGVKRVVYLPLFYKPGVVVSTEHWRGLYGVDDVARPAKTVFDQFRKRFPSGTWRPVARPGLSGGLVDQGAMTSVVMWSTGGTVSLPPPTGKTTGKATGQTTGETTGETPGEITVTDLPDGRSRPWSGGALDVGAQPVIVTLPSPLADTLRWLEST
ncbi:hypothetical protein ACOZ38_34430 [Sphaerisporangium viridialbum]|uniref:hypothetical protein n=1 Tax=Sphaerisporangium viridialbum TaxID=46189 RepID=UPI003C79367B